MEKSSKIYNWIQQRYDHYDRIEGKPCGDKYSQKIFKEASKLFNISVEEVHEKYSLYILDMAQELQNKINDINNVNTLKKHIEKYKSNPEAFIVAELHDKRIKLNTDKILGGSSRKNPKFVEFVKNNRDITFTAKTDTETQSMYCLEEDGMWLFYEDDLIIVE